MTTPPVTTSLLTEHVLVIDRLTPHRIYQNDTLDTDKQPAEWDPKQPRKYVRTIGDALHLGGHAFIGVPFACSCGLPLDTDAATALSRWATHASELAKIPAEKLKAHAIVRLGISQPRGAATPRSTAWCLCGAELRARAADPYDPGQAIAFWADHILRLA